MIRIRFFGPRALTEWISGRTVEGNVWEERVEGKVKEGRFWEGVDLVKGGLGGVKRKGFGGRLWRG